MTDADFYGEWIDPWYDDGAARRYLESLSDMDFTLSSFPGDPTNFNYSDMGYDILATVVQEVSGQVFEYYCQDHILKPLGMTHSTFLKPEVPPGLMFTPYVRDANNQPVVSPLFPYNRVHNPSSGLFTDASDMLLWMQMNLNRGELHGKRILSPVYHDLLFEPLYHWEDGSGYGWGWVSFYDELGRKHVVHGGGQPGVNTLIYMFPGQGVGVTALGNCLGEFDPGYVDNVAGWLYIKLVDSLS